MPVTSTPHGATAEAPERLAARLAYWARTRGAQRAFAFLGPDLSEVQSLSYAALDAAAERLAQRLREVAEAGSRAILMFPSGLEFVIAFFGAHRAGLVPVPVVPARGRRMRQAAVGVVQDCAPELLLAPADYVESAQMLLADAQAPGCRVLEVAFDGLGGADRGAVAWDEAAPCADGELAFIQYTSGSTSAPKGVCVSQANVFANLSLMNGALRNPDGVVYVGWAPLHHDMGLIANLLAPFALGGQCILMSPGHFATQPAAWLQAIERYGARVSGGPNFAYDLCNEQAHRILARPLDLSCWKIAFCSGEPVQAATLARFAARFAPAGFAACAAYPAFGLAEATLFVSGAREGVGAVTLRASRAALEVGRVEPAAGDGDAIELVSSGVQHPGAQIAIVDPETRRLRQDGEVGEIWVAGASIPERYWRRPEASAETFHARLEDGSGPRFLRTGDLGSLVEGELYVTGRLKDLLIIRGRNVYPQDLERATLEADAGLVANGGAAFLTGEGPSQRLVIVQEVERALRRTLDVQAVRSAIRALVFRDFDCTVHDIVLVEPGSIPKTSSGKIKRAATRLAYLAGTLRPIGEAAPNEALAEAAD